MVGVEIIDDILFSAMVLIRTKVIKKKEPSLSQHCKVKYICCVPCNQGVID